VPEPRLRAIVVDDEEPARALLREFLSVYDDVELLAECPNGFEAVKKIAELAPDVVFLDVQMPKLDGFEVLELITPGPAVVFCTAYDEFALKAFDVHAVDYLLKPFGRERLAQALTRVRARVAAAPGQTSAPPAITVMAPTTPGALATAARAPGTFADRVIVKDGAEIHVIPVDTIDVVEAQDDYVAIHVGPKHWLKSQSLAELAASLDPARFVRVHRSYVVRLERIARLEPYAKDSRVAVLADGREVPVSREGYKKLRELMGA
jgi:two-component system LytT family response regulator